MMINKYMKLPTNEQTRALEVSLSTETAHLVVSPLPVCISCSKTKLCVLFIFKTLIQYLDDPENERKASL